ncbi:MAG TPA: ATP-binding cassette domain-containing protein, partial [Anaerolineales bacterium]|nr:ATP-binding cassette domain-containing protein [Anaerolineales bacterium]
CRVLSGGEKARLVMAKMLFDPPNFLVLDEPTNHLDLPSVEQFETALCEFRGTVLAITHDETFAEHVATRRWRLVDGRLIADGGPQAAEGGPHIDWLEA